MLAKCAEIDAWLLGSGVTGRTVCYLSAEFVVRVIASSTEIEWRNNDNRDIYSYVVLSDKKLYRIKVGELPNTGGNDRIVNIPIVQIHRAIASSEALQGVSKKGLSQLRNLTIWNTVVNGIVLPAVGASSVTVLPLSSNTVFENNGDLIRVLEQENKGYYYMEINGELYPIDDTQYSLMYPGREDIVDEVDLGNLKYLRLIKVSPLKAMVIDGVVNNFEVRLFKTDAPISESQLATIIPKLNAINSRTLQVTNTLGVDYEEFWSRVKAKASFVNNHKIFDLKAEDKLLLYDGVSSVWKYYYDKMIKDIKASPAEAEQAILDGLVNPWIEYMAYKDVTELLKVVKYQRNNYGNIMSDSCRSMIGLVLIQRMIDTKMETSVQQMFPYIQELGSNINGIPISEVYNYVQASQWVYDNYKKGTTIREAVLPTGWVNITSEFKSQANGKIAPSLKTGEYYYSDTTTGYQAAILKKPNGDLVMVSRGTELFPNVDKNDVTTDAGLSMGKNPQLTSSIIFYNLVRNNQNYGSKNITHTGHSLGGANANCLAILARVKGHADSSISFDSLGVKEVVKRSIDGFSGSERFEYITEIDVAGDLIGGFYSHIDSPKYTIRPKVENCHSLENFKE